MKKGQKGALATMALFVLMLLCILFLVVLGSRLYAALVQSGAHGDRQRASLSYVSRRVATADEAGGVALREGPAGTLLALAEPASGSGYETYLYWYDGALLEEYVPAGSTPQPDAAQTVARTEKFSAQWQENGLLKISTGEGEVLVALRSEEAAG